MLLLLEMELRSITWNCTKVNILIEMSTAPLFNVASVASTPAIGGR